MWSAQQNCCCSSDIPNCDHRSSINQSAKKTQKKWRKEWCRERAKWTRAKLVSVDLYVFMLKHHFLRTSCSSVKRKLAVKFSQLHIYPGFNIVVNMCQSPQLQFLFLLFFFVCYFGSEEARCIRLLVSEINLSCEKIFRFVIRLNQREVV